MRPSRSHLGISTPRVAGWPPFASDILGCQVAGPGRDGALRLRVDDVSWRIEVRDGDVDDLEFIGWTLTEEADLASYEERLTAAGGVVNHADDDLLAERA